MDNSNSSEEPQTHNEVDENVWIGGKSISHLSSSEHSMDDTRKEIIRRALEFDIIDIRSYAGYKGDLIIEITSMDSSVIIAIKQIAQNLGIETVTKKDLLSILKIYCITPFHHGYDLKED